MIAIIEWVRAQPVPVACLVFVLASLAFVPLTLLLVQAGLLLGAKLGIAVALVAIVISLSAAFAAGRLLRKKLPPRRPWTANAVLPIALLRVLPLAPFTLVNFAAGASPCPYRVFLTGSCVGLLPNVIVCCALGRGLFELLKP